MMNEWVIVIDCGCDVIVIVNTSSRYWVTLEINESRL